MIINASGRTDIVAFYSKWFMKRYKEGFIDVRNPFYPKQISRINFDDVEAILFCTKNPLPIINELHRISQPIVLQITLTPYKEDIEPHVPDKKLIITGIRQLSEIIGKENIFIRYDPILLNTQYTVDYHLAAFAKMCSLLSGYSKHIITSFIDDYKNVRRNQSHLQLQSFSETDYRRIGLGFAKSAAESGFTVQTCCEERNLSEYGFVAGDCIGKELAYQITGRKNHRKWKARNSPYCNCVEMADIGVYNSCPHFCRYCYANYDEDLVNANQRLHNPDSSLLIGELKADDIIKIRR